MNHVHPVNGGTTQSAQRVRDMALIGMSAALIAVCSWISIPVFAVPFTLQTFAVFLTAGLLGGRRGTVAVVVYILLGAAGLPVFSGFRGGIGALLGPTGGYIIGFIFTTLLMGLFEQIEARLHAKIRMYVPAMLAGMFSYYFFGTVWFYLIYTKNTGAITLGGVLTMCVIPFVIPDLIKLALASVLVRRIRPFVY